MLGAGAAPATWRRRAPLLAAKNTASPASGVRPGGDARGSAGMFLAIGPLPGKDAAFFLQDDIAEARRLNSACAHRSVVEELARPRRSAGAGIVRTTPPPAMTPLNALNRRRRTPPRPRNDDGIAQVRLVGDRISASHAIGDAWERRGVTRLALPNSGTRLSSTGSDGRETSSWVTKLISKSAGRTPRRPVSVGRPRRGAGRDLENSPVEARPPSAAA